MIFYRISQFFPSSMKADALTIVRIFVFFSSLFFTILCKFRADALTIVRIFVFFSSLFSPFCVNCGRLFLK
jgi:tRNA nucleotidyltransferase/poly(A) polymerase